MNTHIACVKANEAWANQLRDYLVEHVTTVVAPPPCIPLDDPTAESDARIDWAIDELNRIAEAGIVVVCYPGVCMVRPPVLDMLLGTALAAGRQVIVIDESIKTDADGPPVTMHPNVWRISMPYDAISVSIIALAVAMTSERVRLANARTRPSKVPIEADMFSRVANRGMVALWGATLQLEAANKAIASLESEMAASFPTKIAADRDAAMAARDAAFDARKAADAKCAELAAELKMVRESYDGMWDERSEHLGQLARAIEARDVYKELVYASKAPDAAIVQERDTLQARVAQLEDELENTLQNAAFVGEVNDRVNQVPADMNISDMVTGLNGELAAATQERDNFQLDVARLRGDVATAHTANGALRAVIARNEDAIADQARTIASLQANLDKFNTTRDIDRLLGGDPEGVAIALRQTQEDIDSRDKRIGDLTATLNANRAEAEEVVSGLKKAIRAERRASYGAFAKDAIATQTVLSWQTGAGYAQHSSTAPLLDAIAKAEEKAPVEPEPESPEAIAALTALGMPQPLAHLLHPAPGETIEQALAGHRKDGGAGSFAKEGESCDGACCRVFFLPFKPDAIPMVANGKLIRDPEAPIIADMIIPLSETYDGLDDEHKALLGDYAKSSEAYRAAANGAFYTCRHFIPETNKCGVYDQRPAMCRSYPSERTGCTYSACTGGCSAKNVAALAEATKRAEPVLLKDSPFEVDNGLRAMAAERPEPPPPREIEQGLRAVFAAVDRVNAEHASQSTAPQATADELPTQLSVGHWWHPGPGVMAKSRMVVRVEANEIYWRHFGRESINTSTHDEFIAWINDARATASTGSPGDRGH